jgi:hypothetical protein
MYPLPEGVVGANPIAQVSQEEYLVAAASTTGSGIAFPINPQVGDYFLRIDYLPQLLYRWDGKLWIRISSNVRTDTGFTQEDKSLLSTFINNDQQTKLTNGTYIPQKQALSTMLQIQPDPIPPQV